MSVQEEANAIWVVKPRSKVMHVIPKMEFVPSLCGMVPPGKGRAPGVWSVVEADYVLKVLEGQERVYYTVCPKCLRNLRKIKELAGGAA
ncbi:eL24 family ribosomal protein [Alkalimonas mucilaginosa]|uniref:TRASH domain-containing protein n=1 Tax=Alkalimonas mucilaginosa TaxID=3057676 RepID=A0ABU7JCZ9_9GAMM|nr:TRASH domain-containing protein [Alkalimonas sp. MEB004]MEE2023567.1 TRASH domain-containing protein [Alkalimonas sp. MEB004]